MHESRQTWLDEVPARLQWRWWLNPHITSSDDNQDVADVLVDHISPELEASSHIERRTYSKDHANFHRSLVVVFIHSRHDDISCESIESNEEVHNRISLSAYLHNIG